MMILDINIFFPCTKKIDFEKQELFRKFGGTENKITGSPASFDEIFPEIVLAGS